MNVSNGQYVLTVGIEDREQIVHLFSWALHPSQGTTVWINIIVGSIKQSKFFLVWTQWSIKLLMIRVIRMFQMNLHIQRKQSVLLSREDPN